VEDSRAGTVTKRNVIAPFAAILISFPAGLIWFFSENKI
jgi:hypothetical protein